MNSPYMGKFKVTQQYKSGHTGLDLVGIDSKNIHSTINGTVTKAGWENPNNHAQGWGQRITIRKDGTNQDYTFGHLSQIKVVVGQKVKITDVIGVEGSTGYSTGSHCHYECRLNNDRNQHQDISKISGIPNAIGTYNDGYTGTATQTQSTITLKAGTWNLRTTPSTNGNIVKVLQGGAILPYTAIENGWYKVEGGYVGPACVQAVNI